MTVMHRRMVGAPADSTDRLMDDQVNGREWPTAPRVRDVSVSAPSASAAPVSRSEECVCGGLITVEKGDPIGASVMLHNQSALHAQWRWRRER